MKGDGWKQFITHNGLSEMLCSSLRGQQPRICVIYVDDGTEYPYQSTIVTKRCALGEP
jgi:hypothetical protein